MGPFQNVILDWSGTLVDDFAPVFEATNKIFQHYGKPAFTAEEFRQKFYLPFTDFYKEHLPPEALPELEAHYHAYFKILQETIQPLPYAVEFLEYLLERGIPTFLLSTIHEDHFHEQGTRLGVKKFFRQAYTMAFDKRKTILQLLVEHHLNPAETIFVGDMKHDIETARHGGVTSCAVLTGYDSYDKLKSSNPDLIFRNLREVKDFLERHRGVPTSPPLATVGALIYNTAGDVLLIKTHKWSHKWGIPGGKIKYGETALEGLDRETLEETGLTLKDVKFQLVQDCIEPEEFYKKAHFLLLNYTATITKEEPVVLNHEAEEFQWLPIEKALELDLNTPTRTLIDYVRSH